VKTLRSGSRRDLKKVHDLHGPAGVRQIEEYFARIGEVLGNAKRRSSFAVYAMELLGSAERKSVEPGRGTYDAVVLTVHANDAALQGEPDELGPVVHA
jgi:hypothetical protein